jgi:NADH:ubiquinone oxidoreductase subunit E
MTHIKVCQGHACKTIGKHILERANIEATKRENISVEACLCMGQCYKGPNVSVERDGKKEVLNNMDPIKIYKLIQNEKK